MLKIQIPVIQFLFFCLAFRVFYFVLFPLFSSLSLVCLLLPAVTLIFLFDFLNRSFFCSSYVIIPFFLIKFKHSPPFHLVHLSLFSERVVPSKANIVQQVIFCYKISHKNSEFKL